ncbi:fimbrial protein [Serratia inhibens]|uniref:Fimbrial protein n=1 Tax=Serratia inhibens TaxID=2338073 RepID=A0AA92X161_9GAMM|nr:fimbrial protein [Serratia inhibens]RJF53865.1 fimbrial protein [Serratia inhibens]
MARQTGRMLVLAGGMLLSPWLAAAENMTFHGTLIENPPCTINGGEPVEIDFGEVGVNKVDGQNYAQTFTIIYDCEGTSTDKVLRYLGAATAFDTAAVQSNIADFGIQLRSQSNDGALTGFVVGTTLPIPSYLGSSTFVATPVKKAGAELSEGAFTSAATLQLEYP